MNIKNNIREFLQVVSPKLWSKLYYYHVYGKKCDLNNPTSFSEKLIWLKVYTYENNPQVLSLCDKYEVRQYLIDCGYADLLNELYFVEKDFKKVTYDRLPESFALKVSLGCGTNLICQNKKNLSKEEFEKIIKKWRKGQYLYDLDSARIGGINVKSLNKTIICEKYLTDINNEIPADYKVYCFNGIPKAILFISDRYVKNEKKAAFFDCAWNYIGDSNENYKKISDLPNAPVNLRRMIDASRTLSKPFPFVRVDFYEVEGKLIFGEMTFFPNGCIGTSEIEIEGKGMGDLLNVK